MTILLCSLLTTMAMMKRRSNSPLIWPPTTMCLPRSCTIQSESASNRELRLDATDGKRRVTIPSDSHFADQFEAAFRAYCVQIREKLQAVRIPILPISTHDPVTKQVLAALGRIAMNDPTSLNNLRDIVFATACIVVAACSGMVGLAGTCVRFSYFGQLSDMENSKKQSLSPTCPT